MSPIPNHEPGYIVIIDKGQGNINYDDLTVFFVFLLLFFFFFFFCLFFYLSIYLSIYLNPNSISLEGLFVVLIFCGRMLKLKKIVSRYKKSYYINIMRQSAFMVVNPSIVDSYVYLFACKTVLQNAALFHYNLGLFVFPCDVSLMTVEDLYGPRVHMCLELYNN